jgi:glycine/D-amino acid oxidase-like deaminating enzyme
MAKTSSFWDDEAGGFTASASPLKRDFDVCIIGGGIIGMSTAIEVAERRPDMMIAVMERADGPKGASTRNAGFACFGSLSEVALDVDVLGSDAAADLVRRRVEGLSILRSRCGDDNISYDNTGGREIFLEHHASLDRIDKINELLHPVFNRPAFVRMDNLIEQNGFDTKTVKALVGTEFEGMLHSGLLVSRLWEIAKKRGVQIIKSDVVNLRNNVHAAGKPIELVLKDGTEVICRNVVLAANSAISELIRMISNNGATVSANYSSKPMFQPARGQILLTAPLANLKLHGTYHFDQGFVYFRNVGSRVLIGGGRNVAMADEETTSMDTTGTIQNYLEHILHNVILPGKNVAIEYRWAGTMAFNNSKQPVVGEVLPGVIVAFGCNGMGVAIGSEVAKRTCELIC